MAAPGTVRTKDHADGVRREFADARWANSESVQYTLEAALTGTIVSNAPPVTGLYVDGPVRHHDLPCEPDRLRSGLRNALGSGEVHVLYFSG